VLIPFEVQTFQTAIQQRLHNPAVSLLARCRISVNVDDSGRILYGWSHYGEQTPEQTAMMRQIDTAINDALKRFADIFLVNVDAAPREDGWQARVEVVGARVLSPRRLLLWKKRWRTACINPSRLFFSPGLKPW
jgi:hypothetical protein